MIFYQPKISVGSSLK